MSTVVETPQPVVAMAPTQPHNSQLARQFEECTILSVYPVERALERRHNTFTRYTLPAAPRDSYSTLKVFRTFEWITLWSDDGPEHHQRIQAPIDALTVAQDLAGCWSRHTLAASVQLGPGIDLISGDEPSQAELARVRERQRMCFEWLIRDAHDKDKAGQSKNINDSHRFAAKWMYGNAAERLTWYPKLEQPDNKDCPACAKPILGKAIVCEFCGTNLPNFYIETGLTPDAYVAEFIAKRASAVSPKEPPTPPASKEPRLAQK